MPARRHWLILGGAAFIISLVAPAVDASGPMAGWQFIATSVPRALDVLVHGTTLSGRVIAGLGLVSVSANVLLPVLAWRPGRWRTTLAFLVAAIAIGLSLYLASTSPLTFRWGAAVWLVGVVAWVASHRA